MVEKEKAMILLKTNFNERYKIKAVDADRSKEVIRVVAKVISSPNNDGQASITEFSGPLLPLSIAFQFQPK